MIKQLENERAVNRYNTEKITQLTLENAGNRAQLKALKEEMNLMRESLQNDINALKRDNQILVDERKSNSKIIKNYPQDNTHGISRTVRMYSGKD